MTYSHLTNRRQRFFNSCLIIVACLVLAVLCITVVIGLWVQTAKLPKFLGNNSENITYVNTAANPDDFTFIVVGDIKGGTATFEAMLDIMRPDKPAFAVILGDFVSDPQLIRHKLFAFEMTEHTQNFPIFLIPGNHDVSPDGPFKLKDFETMWGPAQFHFTIGQYLFVFLNNIPPYGQTGEYLKFLEQAISGQAEKIQKIFVFMHVPPSDLNSSIQSLGLEGSQKFMQLAKKYRIDYVFAGDHHGYVKTKKDGTTFIATGGGGARLRGEHGRFHHLVRIAVKNGMISETVIATRKRLETYELMERNATVHLWPLITQNPVSIAVTLVVFGTSIWLLIFSFRRRKELTK